MTFTHLDGHGQARMVDVTAKQPTVRSATASGTASGTVRCSKTGGTSGDWVRAE